MDALLTEYKLGSLFDGSGGFPLSGALCGIEPVWAAEVEPYPIAVTRSRLPNMKHLGDISKVNGAEIEPVDIITFGSPCQDLSVAGKRAGLKHEANGDEETTRSGLFMEAVRIIKEMRKATNGKYPRFALWENVPGAFSSNKGEDFRVVCEELIKIVEPAASMPSVPKGGWNYSDSYIGDGWSLAYRVLDAQYWGVPQRRRRIYLVADFRGECAREVLFEREGLRGYFTQGRTPWQGTPADAESCTGADDREGAALSNGAGGQLAACLYAAYGTKWNGNGGAYSGENFVLERHEGRDGGLDDVGLLSVTDTHIVDNVGGQAEYAKTTTVNGTLRAGDQGLVAYAVENHPADSRVNIDDKGKVQTLTSRMGTGGGNVPMIMQPVVFDGANVTSPINASNPQPGDPCHTLSTDARNYVVETRPDANFIDVEMEVAVRKYEVNTALLCECLRDHKAGAGFSNKEIAERLGRPVTEVEHWFRTDKYFAIPDPSVWYALKKLLGIKTTEFDQSIMTFEYKGGNYDMRNRIHTGEVSPTLTCGSGNDLHLLPSDPVICLQGNGIDRADTAGCNGKGWKEDTSYTLNTIDRPAVAYQDTVGALCRCDYKGAGNQYISDDKAVVEKLDNPVRYIVRRLTPTECARLQGFADWWGFVEKKDILTEEEEYHFWLEVRNTHATINGKKVQDYTEKQMLTWYNKLYTDSAEYKMWGNGIALPTALYVLQGILDTLTTEEDLDEWML